MERAPNHLLHVENAESAWHKAIQKPVQSIETVARQCILRENCNRFLLLLQFIRFIMGRQKPLD